MIKLTESDIGYIEKILNAGYTVVIGYSVEHGANCMSVWTNEDLQERIDNFERAKESKKKCTHSCSPSDYYEGGKCDKNGCYDKEVEE